MSQNLFVGVDAGGTKTAALAALDDAAPRSFRGGAAQALRDGPEAAAAVVADVLGEARAAFPDVPLGGVAVGLAGAGRDDVRQRITDALRPTLNGAPLVVVHDAHIAHYAAWGDASGALLLVGTGSLVYARTEAGDELRAGGWGDRLGDDGSGAALGRAALRGALAALDGGPPSVLPELAAERFGLATAGDVLAAIYGDCPSLGRFCPLLLAAVETGDWVAETALRAEVNALAKQAGWLATRAGDAVTHRLAMAGGLTTEPVYRAALDDALARHLPGWKVVGLDAEPAAGALAMARTLAPEPA